MTHAQSKQTTHKHAEVPPLHRNPPSVTDETTNELQQKAGSDIMREHIPRQRSTTCTVRLPVRLHLCVPTLVDTASSPLQEWRGTTTTTTTTTTTKTDLGCNSAQ